MELVNPWVLYIGAVVLIILSIFRFGRKSLFRKGKKVANAELIEETALYKKLIIKYKIITGLSVVSLILAIACGFILLSRPAKVEQISNELRNRDIFLCLDASGSVAELDIDICEKLKTVVEKLDGERFGITIFNGASVIISPLTNDYEYIIDCLDKLKHGFEELARVIEAQDKGLYTPDDLDYGAFYYVTSGTFGTGGSSLVGDGLTSCLYNFPDLTTNLERSRLIIFATDNDVGSEEYVTLAESVQLCKKNKVKVFSVGTQNVVDEAEFKAATEVTGGKYYKATNDEVFDQLVADIEKTETSVLEKVETVVYDQPVLTFVFMMIFMGIHIVLNRLVKN